MTYTTVLISGLYYSGSSAVYDYLRSIPSVFAFPPTGEFPFMRIDRGLLGLCQDIHKNKNIERSRVDQILDLHLNPNPKSSDYYEEVMARLRGPYEDPLLKANKVFQEEFLKAFEMEKDNRNSQISKAVELFFDTYFSEITKNSQFTHLVLDQALATFHYFASRWFKNPRLLVIKRDIRDQYIDVKTRQLALAEKGASHFYKNIYLRAEAISKNTTQDPFVAKISKVIQFEEFISDFKIQANDILNFLGVSISDDPNSSDYFLPYMSHFKPEVSIKNVGLYKQKTTSNVEDDFKKSISFLEENALPDLLYKGAEDHSSLKNKAVLSHGHIVAPKRNVQRSDYQTIAIFGYRHPDLISYLKGLANIYTPTAGRFPFLINSSYLNELASMISKKQLISKDISEKIIDEVLNKTYNHPFTANFLRKNFSEELNEVCSELSTLFVQKTNLWNEEDLSEVTRILVANFTDRIMNRTESNFLLLNDPLPNLSPIYYHALRNPKFIYITCDARTQLYDKFSSQKFKNSKIPNIGTSLKKIEQSIEAFRGAKGECLTLKYEDLILDFNNQNKKIINFLGMDPRVSEYRSLYFNPVILEKYIDGYKKTEAGVFDKEWLLAIKNLETNYPSLCYRSSAEKNNDSKKLDVRAWQLNDPRFQWFLTNPEHLKDIYKDTEDFDSLYIRKLIALGASGSEISRGAVRRRDMTSPYINVKNNIRKTIAVPDVAQNTIYLLGASYVFCHWNSDADTIASYLQGYCNQYRPDTYKVVNLGSSSSTTANDYMKFLDIKLKAGDYIILLDKLIEDPKHARSVDFAIRMHIECLQQNVNFIYLHFPIVNHVINPNATERKLAHYSYQELCNNPSNDFNYSGPEIYTPPPAITLLKNINCKCEDLQPYFDRPHNMGEVFLDKTHVSSKANAEIGKIIFCNYLNKKFEENVNRDQKTEYLNYLLMESTKHVPASAVRYLMKEAKRSNIKNKELLKWLDGFPRLNLHKDKSNIGCIVMNCNPFTLGHLYLIETALSQIDGLYIFLVEENKSIFPFEDRLELIKKGTAHLSDRVSIAGSGQYIISTVTFPDYFEKEQQLKEIDVSYELAIFGSIIAPHFGIKRRFVGEEPFCFITNQYNDAMRKYLPPMGVNLHVIPRRSTEDNKVIISASQVRASLAENDWNGLQKLVPITTYQYLKDRMNRSGLPEAHIREKKEPYEHNG